MAEAPFSQVGCLGKSNEKRRSNGLVFEKGRSTYIRPSDPIKRNACLLKLSLCRHCDQNSI
jgi:hypothetical protein